MSANTSRVGLYKPGGGSTGLILPDEIADIDKINGNMDLIDAALGILVVTSTTRPAVPFNGQGVYESDTRNTMVYSSAVTRWLPVGVPNAASAALRDAIYPSPVAGMQVFRTDLGVGGMLQVYTGTAWAASGAGLVPIVPTVAGTNLSVSPNGLVTAAAATGALTIDGLGGYDHVVVEYSECVASVSQYLQMFFRTLVPATDTTTNYWWRSAIGSLAAVTAESVTVGGAAAVATGIQSFFCGTGTSRSAGTMNLHDMNVAVPTMMDMFGSLYDGATPQSHRVNGAQVATTIFGGLSFTPSSGNVSFKLRFFGWNNA